MKVYSIYTIPCTMIYFFRYSLTHNILVSMRKVFDNQNEMNEYLKIDIILFYYSVAITACKRDDVRDNAGYIVRFDNVKIIFGVSDLSSCLGNGKCENEGLFIVSVSLTAHNIGVDYVLNVKGFVYTRVLELDNKVPFQRAATTVVLNLHVDDLVWIELNSVMYVEDVGSCITFILIE